MNEPDWTLWPTGPGCYYRRTFDEHGRCVGQGVRHLTAADVRNHTRKPSKGLLWYGPIPEPSNGMIDLAMPKG